MGEGWRKRSKIVSILIRNEKCLRNSSIVNSTSPSSNLRFVPVLITLLLVLDGVSRLCPSPARGPCMQTPKRQSCLSINSKDDCFCRNRTGQTSFVLSLTKRFETTDTDVIWVHAYSYSVLRWRGYVYHDMTIEHPFVWIFDIVMLLSLFREDIVIQFGFLAKLNDNGPTEWQCPNEINVAVCKF